MQRLDQLLVGFGANLAARRQADIAEDEAPVECRALADQAYLDRLADRLVDRELQIDFNDLLAGGLHPLVTELDSRGDLDDKAVAGCFRRKGGDDCRRPRPRRLTTPIPRSAHGTTRADRG